jgi:hypothetical protein
MLVLPPSPAIFLAILNQGVKRAIWLSIHNVTTSKYRINFFFKVKDADPDTEPDPFRPENPDPD